MIVVRPHPLDWIGYMYKTQITDSSNNKTSVHRKKQDYLYISHFKLLVSIGRAARSAVRRNCTVNITAFVMSSFKVDLFRSQRGSERIASKKFKSLIHLPAQSAPICTTLGDFLCLA